LYICCAAALLPAEDLDRLRQLFNGLGDAAADSDSDSNTESEGEPDSEDGTGTGSAEPEAEETSMLSSALFGRVAPAKEAEDELIRRLAFQLVLGRELRGLAKMLSCRQGPIGAAVD
jgi:hypothetical protein